MELASILLARAMALVEPSEFNPRGVISYRDLVTAIVSRYNFQKYPQKLEELDETKGVVFSSGQIGDREISQLVIYTHGLLLDTRASTQESKHLLEEALGWASKELKLAYKPSMIKRWLYTSQIVFYSKASLTGISAAFQKLADGVESNVRNTTGESLRYELTSLVVEYDQLTRKHALGHFSIQRRENTPFSEDKYFSDAPLPTDVHIKLLEQFEADISSK